MPRITPNLWFDTQALEAAELYVSVFPRSRVTDVMRYPESGPGPAGMAEIFADPDPTRADRAMQAMMQMKKLDVAALRAAADGP